MKQYILPTLMVALLITLMFISRYEGYKQGIDYQKQQTPIVQTLPAPPCKPIVKEVLPKNILTLLTFDDLINNLSANYKHISTSNGAIILTTLRDVSKEHKINPIILYFLIHAESSFRWWIKHDLVTVKNEQGKKVKTRAIGLGGVIYEVWGSKLKSANIIETKADLYNITNNIRATAWIYAHERAKALHPKATNPEMSAMLRYFGGSYPSYFKRIDDKIIEFFRDKVYQPYKE